VQGNHVAGAFCHGSIFAEMLREPAPLDAFHRRRRARLPVRTDIEDSGARPDFATNDRLYETGVFYADS